MSGARIFFDAIDASRAATCRRIAEERADREMRAGDRDDDVGDENGGGVGLAPVMPPATALRQHVGTALLGVHDHPLGIVLELSPRGHMSRRYVLICDASEVRDVTFADDAHKEDDDQAQIDIGDDMYERERYADRDIDLTGTEDDPRTRHR